MCMLSRMYNLRVDILFYKSKNINNRIWTYVFKILIPKVIFLGQGKMSASM